MEKHFCDLCGKEIEKSYVSSNLVSEVSRLRIVLTVGLDGKFSGDVCADCVLKEVEKLLKK